MKYEEAKDYKNTLEEINNILSEKLNSFENGIMGLTPDHIKELPEWKKAKSDYDKSFNELRNFNSYFMKTFKKEFMKERRNRYSRA